MSAKLLDGKGLADRLKVELASKIKIAKDKTGLVPGLAYLLVDEGDVSKHYVSGKTKACQAVGMHSSVHIFASNVTENELLRELERFNQDPEIHGILLQLPLPHHLNTDHIVQQIRPKKDVDSFHPINRGLLFSPHSLLTPCTPKGIITLLKENGVALKGKHVVILGRSIVVGKPLAMLMLREDATVTICHQKTVHLEEMTRTADILVAAVGRPLFLKKTHVRPGAVVVDVGINQWQGKLVGDVDPEVGSVASALTPVPGGVGPMTVATLLENTFHAFQQTVDQKLIEK